LIGSTDIIGPAGLGFTKEMFDILADNDFTTFVSGIITEQSILLEGRIGTLVYNTATEPTLTRVSRVEKCLTAAELLDRRINKRLVNVQAGGVEFDVASERKQRDDYLAEAETIINKNLLVVFTTRDGVESSDFANGVLVSTHFPRRDRWGRRLA
jgi:hypothetical protein